MTQIDLDYLKEQLRALLSITSARLEVASAAPSGDQS